jgi:hypothetical protein
VAGWPELQTEAGVMDRSNGLDVSQAVRLVLSIIEAMTSKPIAQSRRENMAGFYQFLLQSL